MEANSPPRTSKSGDSHSLPPAENAPAESASAENAIEYPSPLRLGLVVVTVCISGFLCGLDQTIVATAAPKITRDFNALGDIAWWTSAYLLTSATLQLVYGRLYTLFSTKIVYILALVLFSIGSIVCAAAPNSIALILGRAIAGCGAAGMMSGAVLVLAASCPLEKRASLSGLMFAGVGVASVTGPFIGGALTDRATWRWCFGINLPICAIVILNTIFFVRTPLDPKMKQLSWREKVRRFDVPGTVLLTASIVCVLLALQTGGTVFQWNSARIIALFVVGGVLFISFLAIQILLPSQRAFSTTLTGNRNVVLAALYSGFISGGVFVTVTYLPVWFQAVRGSSALRSGVMLAPLVVSFVVMAALSGGVTQGIGYYNPAMFFGVILFTVGSGLLTTLTPNTSSSKWIGYQVLYGFGSGAGVPSPMLVVQTVLREEDVPVGVSLVNLSQMLWASIVVAIAQSVFVNKLAKDLEQALPNFDPASLAKGAAAGLSATYSPDQLLKVIPAYNNAVSKTFYIAVALGCAAFLCTLGLQWASMKKKEKTPQADTNTDTSQSKMQEEATAKEAAKEQKMLDYMVQGA